MGKTNIEWVTHSWNLMKWFCTKTSPGCAHCYMMELQKRYPQHAADHPVVRPNAWKELAKLPPGAEVFAGDMYDLFHEDMTFKQIEMHFSAALQRPDVTFLFLTKRAERLAGLAPYLPWPQNIYMGVSVESQAYAWRIDYLRKVPAQGKFLSIEPLIGELWTNYAGIDGVIVGAESGTDRRTFDPRWAAVIRQHCLGSGTKFFFKQGSAFKPGQHRDLFGRQYNDLPWRKAEAVQA